MAEDLGERSELPTSRRRQEARDKGQVPKSQDVSGVLTLLAAACVIIFMGPMMAADMAAVMVRIFEGQVEAQALTPDAAVRTGIFAFTAGAKILLPVMLVMFLVAYLANFVQVGPLLTAQPIKPTLGKLNPIQGVKRTFGPKALIKTGVNLLKLAVVIVVCWQIIGRHMGEMASLARLDVLPAVWALGLMALELAAWLLALLMVVAAIDYVFQRWQHTKDIKMTKQEVKDERKSMEGDPEFKGRRLRMARDIALQRIQSSVPQADVVVTNPTHFSVALRYNSEEMRAPRVVASGVDYMAMRIRHVALAHGVPLVERPPLARALYHGVKVGQEVPPEHYEAVAEILAYVYRLEGREAEEIAARTSASAANRSREAVGAAS